MCGHKPAVFSFPVVDRQNPLTRAARFSFALAAVPLLATLAQPNIGSAGSRPPTLILDINESRHSRNEPGGTVAFWQQ